MWRVPPGGPHLRRPPLPPQRRLQPPRPRPTGRCRDGWWFPWRPWQPERPSPRLRRPQGVGRIQRRRQPGGLNSGKAAPQVDSRETKMIPRRLGAMRTHMSRTAACPSRCTCCSSVAFERPKENTSTFTRNTTVRVPVPSPAPETAAPRAVGMTWPQASSRMELPDTCRPL